MVGTSRTLPMLSLIVPLADIVAAVNVPVNVGDADRTLFPEPVLVVTPVPPFATANVPATDTAPVVAVEGVKPVEPKLMEVTPLLVMVTAPVAPETLIPAPATAEVTPVLAMLIEPAPLVTLIAVPAVSVVRVNPAPLPMSNAPLAGVVVRPVPPYATPIAVPFHVPAVMVASVELPVAPSVVNAPVDGVVPPIAAPLIVPPVIVIALAFWVDIVPKPVMAVFGIVVEAVIADVPLP